MRGHGCDTGFSSLKSSRGKCIIFPGTKKVQSRMANNNTPRFLFETGERIIRRQFVLNWPHPFTRFARAPLLRIGKGPPPLRPPSQGVPHCHRRDQAAPLLPPSPPPPPRSLAPTSAIPSLGALQMFGHSAISNKPAISMSFFNEGNFFWEIRLPS